MTAVDVPWATQEILHHLIQVDTPLSRFGQSESAGVEQPPSPVGESGLAQTSFYIALVATLVFSVILGIWFIGKRMRRRAALRRNQRTEWSRVPEEDQVLNE